jgi:hydroxymethylpyrimidine pyrophosphatase-like HAD family hydrolase
MQTRKRHRRARVTRKNYLGDLRTNYPSCKHDCGHIAHNYDGHKITYGEMNYEGMQKLYSYAQKLNPHINTFIDIGSGRGKLCLYLASARKIKKAIGLELVKERHDDAVILKDKLAQEFANKVKFINANILDVSIRDELLPNSEVFVWFSNLCFDQSITDQIFQKLTEELPDNSVVCCSKKPMSENENFQFIDSISIEMSWTKLSTVYVYKIRGNKYFPIV